MATKKYVSPSKLSFFLEKLKDIFAIKNHTHNYAGASSSGGAATSANKLNTDAGSATQPVFFKNGVPVATTYTLGKSVPADAKFTDTTYPAATTSAQGLMSASDKSKLDGIAAGATKISVDSSLSSSSTNPPQNKVVKAAIDAKTNSSILPNDSGEIKTKFRCAQKGYTGTGNPAWYYPLCKFPVNNDGNYASAIISGRIGGWTSGSMSYVNALVWNRDTPGIALIDIAGSASSMNSIWSLCNLAIYVNSDNTATLYVIAKSYFTFDLDIEEFQSGASILYNGTYTTTAPAGTQVALASTTTKRLELYNGKLYAAGKELATATVATTGAAGLMSATDKSKLDGIASGANKTTVDSALSSTSTNPVQNKVINTALSGKANSSHIHKMSDVSDVDSYVFITTDDIDEICGATIVSADEAVF